MKVYKLLCDFCMLFCWFLFISFCKRIRYLKMIVHRFPLLLFDAMFTGMYSVKLKLNSGKWMCSPLQWGCHHTWRINCSFMSRGLLKKFYPNSSTLHPLSHEDWYSHPLLPSAPMVKMKFIQSNACHWMLVMCLNH